MQTSQQIRQEQNQKGGQLEGGERPGCFQSLLCCTQTTGPFGLNTWGLREGSDAAGGGFMKGKSCGGGSFEPESPEDCGDSLWRLGQEGDSRGGVGTERIKKGDKYGQGDI